MRRFELVEEGSRKFWEVEVAGSTVTVRFGRLGTEGQTKAKEHPSSAAAQKDADKLVVEKVKKGYLEVGPAAPPTVGAPTAPGATDRRDLDRAKKAFPGLHESTYGELTFTSAPSIVDSFLTDEDADRWKRVFSGMEWVAEEADGGAVGYWTHAGETVVVLLDNEGSFHVTGRRFVDHLAHAANGEDASLKAFCKKEKLDSPMTEAQRRTLAKSVKLPDAVFAELPKAAKAKPAAARPAAKSTKPARGGAPAKIEKGPRPFARVVAGCVLADGRLFLVTGEDFGKSYGATITNGATFTFDPASSTFTRHPAATEVFEAVYAPAAAFPSAKGALVLAHPHDGPMLAFEWDAAKGRWSRATPTPIRHDFSTVARGLQDGRVLLFGGERAAVAIGSGSTWEKLPDLPEPRSYDRVVPLGDKLWILGGEAKGESYFGSTDRTWLLDLGKKRWSEGPTLPRKLSRVLALGRKDGSVAILDDGTGWRFDGGKFSAKKALPALEGTSEVHVRVDDDTLLSARWKDGVVVRTNLASLTTTEVGTLALAQGSSTPFALPDGRVLFVGGTLFANNEAEPEIFSLAEGKASPIPGWDADVARQRKALEKDREKRAKRG